MTDAADDQRTRDRAERPREAGDPRRDPPGAVPVRARPDGRRHRAADDRHRPQRATSCTPGSVTIYLLTSTISGPIYGKLSDLFGRRPIIIFAVSLFLIGSALCGLSQEMWQLILFRGIQGLGGGAVFPVALAVVADLYTPAERGKYLGLFGAVFGVSSLVGPAIGGFITDTFGWHWIFFVNVPIGLISLVILWRLLPAIAGRRPAGTSTTWALRSSPWPSRRSSSASRTSRPASGPIRRSAA